MSGIMRRNVRVEFEMSNERVRGMVIGKGPLPNLSHMVLTQITNGIQVDVPGAGEPRTGQRNAQPNLM